MSWGSIPARRSASWSVELEAAVYAGEVKDRDQALALVARLRQDAPP